MLDDNACVCGTNNSQPYVITNYLSGATVRRFITVFTRDHHLCLVFHAIESSFIHLEKFSSILD
jgi:hypothetical protein